MLHTGPKNSLLYTSNTQVDNIMRYVNPHTHPEPDFDGHDLFLQEAIKLDYHCMNPDCNGQVYRKGKIERCENAHHQRTIHIHD